MKTARFLKRLTKWLHEPADGSQSIPMPTGQNDTQTPTSPEPNNIPSHSMSHHYHQSCEGLPYRTFVRIMITNDIKLLTIEGEPEQRDLELAWHVILTEYSEAIQTDKSKNITNLWRKIVYTQWKITFIDYALAYLKHTYDSTIAEKIFEQGYDLIEDNTDRQAYLKQIYLVETEAKTLIVLLNQYTSEYRSLNPTGGVKVARTMMDYEKELRVLSKYMKIWLRMDDLLVPEFCSIVNIFLEESKANKK